MVSLKERIEKINKEARMSQKNRERQAEEKARKEREKREERETQKPHEAPSHVTVITGEGTKIRAPLHRTRDGFLVDEDEGTPVK